MLAFHTKNDYIDRMGRKSKTEPFRSFVKQQLESNPQLLTAEILALARAKGYTGSYSPFFMMVKAMRPDGTRECRECGQTFSRLDGDRRNAIFCNGVCKAAFHAKERALQPAKGYCYQCREPIVTGRLCDECCEAKRTWTNEDRREKRNIAIQHYGGKCSCPGCAVTQAEFLAFDHVDGGGNQHRKSLGDGSRLASWLIDNNFPATIRLLCHNCNCARGYYGYCPHEKEQR